MSIYNEFITLFEKEDKEVEHKKAPVVPKILKNSSPLSRIAESLRGEDTPQDVMKFFTTPDVGTTGFTKMALCPTAVNMHGGGQIAYFEDVKKFYIYLYDKICKPKNLNFNLYFENEPYNSSNLEHKELFRMAVNKNIIKIGKCIDLFLSSEDNVINTPEDKDKPKRGKPSTTVKSFNGLPITTKEDFGTFIDQMVKIFNLPNDTKKTIFETMSTPDRLIRDGNNAKKKDHNGIRLTEKDSISRIFTSDIYNNPSVDRYSLVKMLDKQINDANINELETIYNFIDTLLPQTMRISNEGKNINADKTVTAVIANSEHDSIKIKNGIDLFNKCSDYINTVITSNVFTTTGSTKLGAIRKSLKMTAPIGNLSSAKVAGPLNSEKRDDENDIFTVDFEKETAPITEVKKTKTISISDDGTKTLLIKPLDITLKMLLYKAIAKKSISFKESDRKSGDAIRAKTGEFDKTSQAYGYSRFIPLQWVPRIKELISVAYASANDYRKNGTSADISQFFALSDLFQRDIQNKNVLKYSKEELELIDDKNQPSTEDESYKEWLERSTNLQQTRDRTVERLCGGGTGGMTLGILNKIQPQNRSPVTVKRPDGPDLKCLPMEAVLINLGDELTKFLYGINSEETKFLVKNLNRLAAPSKLEYVAQTTMFSTVDFRSKLYWVDKIKNINVPELIIVPMDDDGNLNRKGAITYNNPDDTDTKVIVSEIKSFVEGMVDNFMVFQKTLPHPDEELNDCIKAFVCLFDLDPKKYHPVKIEIKERPVQAWSVAQLSSENGLDSTPSNDEKLDDTRNSSINKEGE